MSNRKYDWSSLKLEFMQGDHKSPHSFFKDKFGTATGNMRKKSTGWSKEKQARQEHIYVKAIENHEKRTLESLEVPIAMIQKGKKNALLILMKGLEKYIDKAGKITDNFDVGAIAKILDKLKTELKEPINITRQYNTEVKDDSLTEEEQILITKIEAERAKK